MLSLHRNKIHDISVTEHNIQKEVNMELQPNEKKIHTYLRQKAYISKYTIKLKSIVVPVLK
jgi:hypothetical protein